VRFRVGHASDVPEGGIRGFSPPGLDVPVLIARVGGELYACASTCPHGEVSLLQAALDGGVIVCPGHGYRFDLATGACEHDPTLPLLRYAVETEGDELYVRLVGGG
jgi:3-phenylpropionate/trans-cinnamate dioxygenase ferredoxin subunit